ncbi:MAG: hypothetical protein QOF28_217 [Actinomycetota bacterium]|jgi:hypothetical protein|nr:hypothetical protein [Actinomycetota bacterium]
MGPSTLHTPQASRAGVRSKHTVAIFLVSLAGLLLEVGYTRVISYKLWYYYTYLVIGLALLGIGSGGIFVVVIPRLRRAATDSILAGCSLVGAVLIAVGYVVVARIPIDTVRIWVYGTASSYKNLGVLGFVCFVLFASFIALGIIIATILGRASERVGRLYFADLLGAGLGCLCAIPLIVSLGPPEVIMLSALIFAAVGVLSLPRRLSVAMVAAVVIVVVLAPLATGIFGLPDVRTEQTKGRNDFASYSAWGPVFRVDVVKVNPTDNKLLLLHDGSLGSVMYRYDGNPASLGRYKTDPRALPFRTLGSPPDQTLIIGSAAGNEILASRSFGAHHIDAVELNPVTLSLLTNHFADYSGHLGDQPGVSLHNADGRNYLARSDKKYDLIWYVAPDSYAVSNAASSGAFVLSESYLYTSEMIAESLRHLTTNGIMVVQFGELDFTNHPNRTARYVMTARDGFKKVGIDNPAQHLIVASFVTHKTGDLSTIILKRTPFSAAEVDRYKAALPTVPQVTNSYAPGLPPGPGIIPELVSSSQQRADAIAAAYPRQISAVTDDKPFFWHFVGFGTVLRHIFTPLDAHNPEDVIGERVLLLLLAVAIVFAALFLLAPFFFVRKEWRRLPSKGISAVYFAALGLGFMFFEITMIQRLVRFLGYPTYSLTVTLASILVFTGLGALLSKRFSARPGRVVPGLFAVLFALTLLYVFALDGVTDSLLTTALGVRIVVTLLLLAPLGLCLGMFMPLGLGLVAGLSEHADEYVAWSWAVNGFFSVIGSVLTTILAMTFGFRLVQLFALVVYAVAGLALRRLQAIAERPLPETAAPVPSLVPA